MTTDHTIEAGDPQAPDVVELLEASERLAYELYPPSSVHMLDVSELEQPRVRFLVARTRDGKAEGCGALVIESDGSAELKRMFVAPTARGRGLGALILRRLEAEALVAGVRVIRLETGISQPEAIRMYQQSGYRDREPFGGYVADPLSLYMEKELPVP